MPYFTLFFTTFQLFLTKKMKNETIFEGYAVLNALPLGKINCPIRITPIEITEAVRRLEFEGFASFVGHESTAQILSDKLGIYIPFNRSQHTFGTTYWGDIKQDMLVNGCMVFTFAQPLRLNEGERLNEAELLNLELKCYMIE